VTTLLNDAVRDMIGSRVHYRAPDPLSHASSRYFAAAIGSDPARWRSSAPPTLICETNQLTGNATADDNAYLGHSWALPLPLDCEMIRGGNDYRFGRPARPDDIVNTEYQLLDAVEREGKDGTPLLFVTSQATYRAEDGEWLATNTETLIYRARSAS
jgi:hypothetical protein